MPSTNSNIDRKIDHLGPWFHNLHLPNGTQTAPDHWLGDFPRFKWRQIKPHLPRDLTGWRVLDIGCNAGFYSFELAKRGAMVTGIDINERYLAQARWAAIQFGLQDQVEFRQRQVYELVQSSGKYDLILFMGVFYHLRYPLLALDIVAQRVNRLLLFQSLIFSDDEATCEGRSLSWTERAVLTESTWPHMAFLEHGFAGDPTNQWVPNRAAVEALLRSVGMKTLCRPGDEIYLCEPMSDASPATWLVEQEYDPAVGALMGLHPGVSASGN